MKDKSAIDSDFCVIIISRRRPNKVSTFQTLKRCGYDGPLFILLDDSDHSVDLYKEKYQDKVVVFSKSEMKKDADLGDNTGLTTTTTFARNKAFDVAKQKGFRYFLVLDDDYTNFDYIWRTDGSFKKNPIRDLNRVFNLYVEALKSTKCTTIAMAQHGDFIGGENAQWAKEMTFRRKAMNSFFCDVDRPFKFLGRLNEDVNTYVVHGHLGALFLTHPYCSLNQTMTQTSSGGMSETYIDGGTYSKAFMSVMYLPSAVKVSVIGLINQRIHHRISWKNCVPCIVSEAHRKTI
ncbi:MAG: hypothetical protein ACRCT6_03050 [Notoacmeibacter sp.]